MICIGKVTTEMKICVILRQSAQHVHYNQNIKLISGKKKRESQRIFQDHQSIEIQAIEHRGYLLLIQKIIRKMGSFQKGIKQNRKSNLCIFVPQLLLDHYTLFAKFTDYLKELGLNDKF